MPFVFYYFVMTFGASAAMWMTRISPNTYQHLFRLLLRSRWFIGTIYNVAMSADRGVIQFMYRSQMYSLKLVNNSRLTIARVVSLDSSGWVAKFDSKVPRRLAKMVEGLLKKTPSWAKTWVPETRGTYFPDPVYPFDQGALDCVVREAAQIVGNRIPPVF